MGENEEIQELINKIVLNEQVRLVKQNVPEEKLNKNQAYLENMELYKVIKDAFKNDEKLKQRIETQVERNKAVIEKELEPTPEVKENNVLMLRALKLMQAKNVKRENSEKYERIGSLLVDLEHLAYVAEVQDYIEEFSGGKVSGEDEIRKKNKKVYDAVKFMQKKGHKNKLQDIVALRTKEYLNELKEKLNEIGDIGSYNNINEIKTNNGLNKYKDRIVELRKLYETKDEKYTDGDKYIIQYAKEQRGKNYGKKAVSYEGQMTALMVSRQSLFEKVAKKVNSIFNRKPKKTVEPATIEAHKDESGLTVKARRNRVSPKANVDSGRAIESASEQEQETDTERNDFE